MFSQTCHWNSCVQRPRFFLFCFFRPRAAFETGLTLYYGFLNFCKPFITGGSLPNIMLVQNRMPDVTLAKLNNCERQTYRNHELKGLQIKESTVSVRKLCAWGHHDLNECWHGRPSLVGDLLYGVLLRRVVIITSTNSVKCISMVIHDTECPYGDQVSLNNTNKMKPNPELL